MALYPKAVLRLIPPGANDPRIRPRLAILHTDAGNATSLYNYFNGPSNGIESHFHIRKTGVVEQYRDTAYQADANFKANDYAISIETQGFGTEAWTPEQMAAIKDLLLWIFATHPEVLRQVTQTATGSGVGYHIMFGAPGPWTPNARSCPGPLRIKQFREDITPWLKASSVPVQAPTGAHRTVTVKAGDTLTKIAAALGVSLALLIGANSISNPDAITPGQVITVPDSAPAVPAPSTPAPAPAPAPAPTKAPTPTTTTKAPSRVVYVVRSGDTLSEIAARYRTSVSALKALNGIKWADRIYVGQRLVIRASAASAVIYRVRSGDTLSEIAARYRTSVRTLVRANPSVKSADRIYVGQRLVIR